MKFPYEFRRVKITKEKFSELITYLFYNWTLYYEKNPNDIIEVHLWTIKDIGHPGNNILIIETLELMDVWKSEDN